MVSVYHRMYHDFGCDRPLCETHAGLVNFIMLNLRMRKYSRESERGKWRTLYRQGIGLTEIMEGGGYAVVDVGDVVECNAQSEISISDDVGPWTQM